MGSRIDAVQALSRRIQPQEGSKTRPFEFFEARVFDRKAQELFLSPKIAHHWEEVRKGRARLDLHCLDAIADALREWATKEGATHFCHWFQPLNGQPAEKEDSFLSWSAEGGAIEKLKGKELLTGEPDASSLPSGGLRATHEARGYTAWDPTAFPFLWETAAGLTLCIPALFFSWKGEALDQKIPLLRSEQKLSAVGARLLAFCGEKGEAVHATLGIEQEYFLIDQALYLQRPDLILTGRTVFGAKPAKGQDLEDHYFGPLKDRVAAFMRDYEEAAIRLGIPVRTRHNEVAPAQHEVAPLFESCSQACDHNVVLMQLLKQTAARHGLVCLLHEKPFAHFNGSGKHNNWSLASDAGKNLLSPKAGSLLFLLLLAALLRGIHDHAALLRASIASAGNDFRLGGAEAPPAIPSVFLGEELEKIVHSIAQGVPQNEQAARSIDLGLRHLPVQDADRSDRNRTSFFAFAGNKFEFRAVGASASCAFPVAVLNAITADSLALLLDEAADAVRDTKNLTEKKKLEIVLPVLQKWFRAALPICFNGDGYSAAWKTEADQRGLPNLERTDHALIHLRSKKTVRVFEGILSEKELESRCEIAYERYAKQREIEGRVMLELLHSKILPAAQRDLAERAKSLKGQADLGSTRDRQLALFQAHSRSIEYALEQAESLAQLLTQATGLGWEAKARVYSELGWERMRCLREAVDQLELWVDDAVWPLPKYREMLFLI